MQSPFSVQTQHIIPKCMVHIFFSFQPSDTTDQPTGPTSDAAAAAPALVIWGTDVVVSETKEKFRKFICEFVDEEAEDMGEGFDPLLPVYMQRLDEVSSKVHNELNWPVMSITKRQGCSLRNIGGSPVLRVPSIWFLWKKPWFSSHPESKVRCHGATARAQPR